MSRRLILVVLGLAILPLVTISAVQSGSQSPWLAAPDALLAISMLTGLMINGGWQRLVIACMLIFLAGLSLQVWPNLMIPVFPILLYLCVAEFFARSLRSGKDALITRIARFERGGDLPEELVLYSRALTRTWAWFMRGLALTALLMALITPIGPQLLFANTLSPMLIIAFFVLEYLYRRRRYRAYGHGSILHLMTNLARQGWLLPEDELSTQKDSDSALS